MSYVQSIVFLNIAFDTPAWKLRKKSGKNLIGTHVHNTIALHRAWNSFDNIGGPIKGFHGYNIRNTHRKMNHMLYHLTSYATTGCIRREMK